MEFFLLNATINIKSESSNSICIITDLLTGSEMDLLNKLLELLQPMFYLATKLSTEKFPPCSLVIPSIEKLESYFME